MYKYQSLLGETLIMSVFNYKTTYFLRVKLHIQESILAYADSTNFYFKDYFKDIFRYIRQNINVIVETVL